MLSSMSSMFGLLLCSLVPGSLSVTCAGEVEASSAAWWLRYSTAKPLLSEASGVVGFRESAESAAVQVMRSGIPMERLYFVRAPDWRSSKNVSMPDFVRAAELSWASVMTREQGYTPWVDFHDGHEQVTMNIDNFKEDAHPLQYYNQVSRAYIPNTTWTMEWLGSEFKWDTSDYMKSATYDDPDTCRNNAGFEKPNRTYWKSTFAVADARAARDYAIRVLGAQHVGEPYPWPPLDNCIAAQWVVLPQSSFQLHFVENPVYESMLLNISEFLMYQKDFAQRHTECINSFMLNNLVLQTTSLDPFIRRLEDEATPYFVFDLGNLYALMFSFPGNEGVTLQLQSTHVSWAVPVPLKLCS